MASRAGGRSDARGNTHRPGLVPRRLLPIRPTAEGRRTRCAPRNRAWASSGRRTEIRSSSRKAPQRRSRIGFGLLSHRDWPSSPDLVAFRAANVSLTASLRTRSRINRPTKPLRPSGSAAADGHAGFSRASATARAIEVRDDPAVEVLVDCNRRLRHCSMVRISILEVSVR